MWLPEGEKGTTWRYELGNERTGWRLLIERRPLVWRLGWQAVTETWDPGEPSGLAGRHPDWRPGERQGGHAAGRMPDGGDPG